MTQRAFYSVDDTVLAEFNRLVPARKRSSVITELMAKHVATNDTMLEKAAHMIEADPDYRHVQEDSNEFTFESLLRLETNEQR